MIPTGFMSLTSITSIFLRPSLGRARVLRFPFVPTWMWEGEWLPEQNTPGNQSNQYLNEKHELLASFSSQPDPSDLLVLCRWSYLPDSFLGDFLLRVARSNFAEAGGRIALLITTSFAVVPFP